MAISKLQYKQHPRHRTVYSVRSRFSGQLKWQHINNGYQQTGIQTASKTQNSLQGEKYVFWTSECSGQFQDKGKQMDLPAHGNGQLSSIPGVILLSTDGCRDNERSPCSTLQCVKSITQSTNSINLKKRLTHVRGCNENSTMGQNSANFQQHLALSKHRTDKVISLENNERSEEKTNLHGLCNSFKFGKRV